LYDFFYKTANELVLRNEGQAHSQPAFKVVCLSGFATLAAGGSQLKDASGGPAGGQTFEKFDKQVLKNTLGYIESPRRM